MTASTTRSRVAVLALTALLATWLMSVPRLLAAGETLDLSPSHGQPGDSSTASGSGFVAGATVSLDWDGGGSLGSGAVDGSGGFSIPISLDAAPGNYTVTACATVTAGCDGGTATAGYTVEPPATPTPAPALALSPDTGPAGATSTASGSDFLGGTVEVTWDGGGSLGSGAVDGSGGFSIPISLDAAPGNYTVTACATVTAGCDGGTATAGYTVEPPATPTPTPTVKPSPGPTQTPEATTTHLLTATPERTLAPGETATASPSPSPPPGTPGGAGGGGGTIDPRLLLLAGAFVVVLLGAWAYFRYGPSAEQVPGPVFGPTARLASGLFTGAILLAVVAGGVIADAGRSRDKVVICHLDTLHGTYRPIRIDGAAVVIHQLRGDVLPDAADECP